MPFEIHDGKGGPGDFRLAPTAGYTPNADEQACLDRFNGFVEKLTGFFTDDSLRGAEALSARNACLEELHHRAVEFVYGAMSPKELYATTFLYERRFEERVAGVRAAAIIVAPRRDPSNPENLVDVQYDIGPGTTTKEQLDLKRAIDNAVTVVKVVLAEPKSLTRKNFREAYAKGAADFRTTRRNEYIRGLVSIARVGLFEGNIQLARDTLDALQQEFVATEAPWIKNSYVRRLAVWSAIFAVLAMAAYLHIKQAAGIGPELGWRVWLLPDAGANPPHPFTLYRLRNFLLLGIGASFSAWLAFLIRTPRPEFASLMQLDDELLNPVTRVLFTIALSFVVGLLFWTGMIAIKMGNFTTDFENAGTTAILIGVFCGIASRALATAVSRRAEDFAGNVGAARVGAGAAATP